VQRAETAAPADIEPVATTVPAGPAQVAPPAGAGHTPEQLDELARRLVGPLTRQIKADMLLDRERRGVRTDSR
jgi:hypothetical protein